MSDFKKCEARLAPVNSRSAEILQKKEFALIGISPFNSYFSAEKIFEILQVIDKYFNDYAIFIPDKISYFTLKALGYDESRIAHKIRKQDNYLRNRAKKALNQMNEFAIDKRHDYRKIVTLSDIENKQEYIDSYNICKNMMQNNKAFKDGCISASSWVLSSSEKNNSPIISDYSKEIAVEYFIKELPLFLAAPSIFDTNSCLFIYNTIPSFLQEIYDSYDLASENMGFAIFRDVSDFAVSPKVAAATPSNHKTTGKESLWKAPAQK